MGLSISVGLLYDQACNDAEGFEYHTRAFDRLSRALSDVGIAWQEPGITDPPSVHTFSAGFPYSYLTHLRRIYALVVRREPVASVQVVSREQYDIDSGKVQDETEMFDSHLLCHSDSGGYYIPVDFAEPLFLPEKANVDGGGMVGSSQRLLAELARIAPSLGIQLDPEGVLAGVEAAKQSSGGPDDEPFEPERYAWYQLHQACVTSIVGGHAIVFS